MCNTFERGFKRECVREEERERGKGGRERGRGRESDRK
jgi:hypothetical protein